MTICGSGNSEERVVYRSSGHEVEVRLIARDDTNFRLLYEMEATPAGR